MDSKEGIGKTEPADARDEVVLDPSNQRLGPDDTETNIVDMGTDPLWAGSPTRSSIPPDGIRKWE